MVTDNTVSADRDDRTTLRSFGSCGNLTSMNSTAQRAATLRRQASQTLGAGV
jgi:hypothetical protein